MAEESTDTGRLRKQLEYYETEVRRLEQTLSQQQLGFNKQVTDLEQKVKELNEELEVKTKQEPPKQNDPDQQITVESNSHLLLLENKDSMIQTLETENK